MAMSSGKQICLWIIILGMMALITGGVAPFWLNLEYLTNSESVGLWYHCASNAPCKTYAWSTSSLQYFNVWFYILHVSAGISILICIVALFVALGKICGKQDTAPALGIAILVAGCLGIAASVIFYLKALTGAVSPEVLDVFLVSWQVGWAFYAFAVGTGVITLFGCALLCLPGQKNRVQPHH